MGKLSMAVKEHAQSESVSRGWSRLVESLDEDDRKLLMGMIDDDSYSVYRIVQLLRQAEYAISWETINLERQRRRRAAEAAAAAEAEAAEKPKAAAGKRGRA